MWKITNSCESDDLNQFQCSALLKRNPRGSSEEPVQPKPNSSSDRSGLIWVEQLCKVQIRFSYSSALSGGFYANWAPVLNCPGPNCPGPNLPRTVMSSSCTYWSAFHHHNRTTRQLRATHAPNRPINNAVEGLRKHDIMYRQ